MTVLIAYATVEGQTAKIAHFVEGQVRDTGQETTLLEVDGSTGDVQFETIDSVILAASVHERRHPKAFEVFVGNNRAALAERSVLLLSVSLSAAFDDHRDEAQDYLDEMKLRTGLEPAAELLVAGAVRPESYDDYAARVLRQVVLKDRAFVTTTRDHEFTNWDELALTVADFLKESAGVR
jgi:menaquinone-dependent protoporphyrinogen oxidase